jgi:hypothetical protein
LYSNLFSSRLLFNKYRVRISISLPAILTEDFRDFAHGKQMSGQYLAVDHNRIVLNYNFSTHNNLIHSNPFRRYIMSAV